MVDSSDTTEFTQEAPDIRGPAIVVTGSVISGLKFYGPFETIDDAVKWYGDSLLGKLKANVTIALLESPTPRSPT